MFKTPSLFDFRHTMLNKGCLLLSLAAFFFNVTFIKFYCSDNYHSIKSISRFTVSFTTNRTFISNESLVDKFYLDSQCKPNPSDSSTFSRVMEFNSIFDHRIWNPNERESRSGTGSTLEGAFDWIRHLRIFIQDFHIRSIADIPCGDTYWQFSIREINTIEQLYFGGDISTRVIEQNRKLYGSIHQNKLFDYWDLVNCPVPTFSYRNGTQISQSSNQQFDL